MGADLQSLMVQSSETDVKALFMAKENAKRRMIEDPSVANVAAFDRATIMLDKVVAAQGGGKTGPKHFERLSDVAKYFKDEHYKIGKSKLYADAKAGLLTGSETDGYSIEAVLAYAYTQKLEKKATPGEKLDALAEKRLQKEVEKLTAQVEKLQFDLSRDYGKYLPKEEVRMEMALRVSAFEAGIKHIIRTKAHDWIEAIGGDLARMNTWIETLYAHFDELLAEMATIEELNLVVAKATPSGLDAARPATPDGER